MSDYCCQTAFPHTTRTIFFPQSSYLFSSFNKLDLVTPRICILFYKEYKKDQSKEDKGGAEHVGQQVPKNLDDDDFHLTDSMASV